MVIKQNNILVVGAGMAGLSCATRLARAGYGVTVLDKGRGPGGRMAARRAEIRDETVSFDHGAQYFTARDAAFRVAVDGWEQQGVVARWPAAGQEAWVGMPGMNGPLRAMAMSSGSQQLNVLWNIRVAGLKRNGDHWRVATDSGENYNAQIVLIAVPAEQAGALLGPVAPALAALADGIKSEPCWAVMAAFSERLPLAADTLRFDSGPISWAARNSAKPARTGSECWVLHASPQRSRALLDFSGDAVGPLLLADFFAQTSVRSVVPLHLTAHRWLYAMPAAVAGDPSRFNAQAGIGIAGDYLHSPRVEGAWISGTALAEAVLKAQ